MLQETVEVTLNEGFLVCQSVSYITQNVTHDLPLNLKMDQHGIRLRRSMD